MNEAAPINDLFSVHSGSQPNKGKSFGIFSKKVKKIKKRSPPHNDGDHIRLVKFLAELRR